MKRRLGEPRQYLRHGEIVTAPRGTGGIVKVPGLRYDPDRRYVEAYQVRRHGKILHMENLSPAELSDVRVNLGEPGEPILKVPAIGGPDSSVRSSLEPDPGDLFAGRKTRADRAREGDR